MKNKDARKNSTIKRLMTGIMAVVLSAVLTGCGAKPSLITEQNEETGGVEVTADRVYGTGNGTNITIAEGQCLVASPQLKSGHIVMRLMPEESFNEAMENDAAGTLTGISDGSASEASAQGESGSADNVQVFTVEGSDMQAFALAPGDYYLFIMTEDEKTTGTVSIMPYDIEELRQQDAALAETLADLPAGTGDVDIPLPSGNQEETAGEETTGEEAATEETTGEEAAAEETTGEEAAAEEEDGQNPVMNFIGPYVWDRVGATVECSGAKDAKITITWGSSAWENSEWVMTGTFDEKTMTVAYTDCVRTDYVYKDGGELESATVAYENGTGTITFHDESPLSFTWIDDQEHIADKGVFTWSF